MSEFAKFSFLNNAVNESLNKINNLTDLLVLRDSKISELEEEINDKQSIINGCALRIDELLRMNKEYLEVGNKTISELEAKLEKAKKVIESAMPFVGHSLNCELFFDYNDKCTCYNAKMMKEIEEIENDLR